MEVVTRDDPEEEYGILPGDANRTAMGKIVAMDNQHTGPVLRSFGKEFKFMIVEKGDLGGADQSVQGPGLAHVMDWYKDPDSKDQICFVEEGVEYMRFHPETRTIRYSESATEASSKVEERLDQLLEGALCIGKGFF